MNRPAAPVAPYAQWFIAGLVATTLIVFANVRTFDFVSYDDPWYITNNPNIAQGLTWQGLRWAFSAGYLFYWQPATWISHMLDVQVFGMKAGGHHVVNLLWHLASTALFAVHPLHVESVAWVAERKDVLSTFFLTLTLWAYVGYAQARTARRFMAVALWFVCGLMAKPMLVTLPLVLLLIDIWPLRRLSPGSRDDGATVMTLLREKVPLFALAVVVGVTTFIVQSQVGAVGTLEQLPLSYRVSNAVLSYARYAWLMVWPTGLSVFYPYPPELPPWWHVAGIGTALIGITIAAVRAAASRPYLLVGWLWYVITLLPVTGLLQAGDQLIADRFTYVPLVGLFIIVAWSGADVLAYQPRLRIAAWATALVTVLACAVTARQQVQYWQNSETLWRRALAVTTGNHRAHAALGEVFERQGKIDDAISEYREALRLVPDQAEWRNNLGLLYAAQGKVAEAMGQFAIATRVRPSFADAHVNLGAMHARAGQSAEAIAAYTEAVRLEPGNALAHGNLALALANAGRLAEAMHECAEALRLEPDNDRWRQLSALLSQRDGKRD
jgi:Tfp pilus assembly protein PilF